MTDEQQKEWDLKLRKMDAEISNLNVQNSHLAALTAKALTENRWYPAVVASGATLAIVAIVKIFF